MDKHLPLNWFNFYVYFRFPLGIISILISLVFICTNSILFSINTVFLNLIYLLVISLTYTLMFRKSIKGYYFNIAFLLIETLYIVLNINVNISEYFSMFFIFFMIWFLPNYIYFKKRLYLFCNNSKNNENLEEIIDKKHINTSDTVYPLKIVIPYMIIFAILLIGGLLFYFIINEKDTKISNIESNIVQLENSLKNIKIDKQNLNNELSILF